MNPEKIGPLYERLSEHFNVPMIEWKILPKIPKKSQSKTRPLPYLEIRTETIEEIKGRFIEKPTPIILFWGTPTLKTAMHEFMHYLVYCVKGEKEKKD